MECPICNSRQILKDYPPFRGYALLLCGLAMLGVRSFFNPQILSAQLAVESNRLLAFGAALFAYGAYCLVRHGNRYCASCGMKLRQVSHAAAAGSVAGMSRIEQAEAKVRAQQEKGSSGMVAFVGESEKSEHRESRGKPSNTKIGPLLSCLKFKDPVARANAAKTLQEISGQDFGEDYDAWKEWFENNSAHGKKES